jgi:predicted O-linked N-acetylglucosamine transferase (SPINDLY family)
MKKKRIGSPQPGSFQHLLQQALFMHKGRATTLAEDRHLKLLKRTPIPTDAIRSLGLSAAEQGFYEEAQCWLEIVVALRVEQPQAHIDLARVLRQQGLTEPSTLHFERAAALAAGDPQIQLMAQLARAALLDEQGRYDEALAAFEDAASKNPASIEAWSALGALQRHLGQLESAEASFSQSLRIDPTQPVSIELFGMTLQDQRRYEDASLVFERLLLVEPERHLVLGRLMHTKMLGADWTALNDLKKMIERDITAGKNSVEPFGLQGYCDSPGLLKLAAQTFSKTYHPPRTSRYVGSPGGDGQKIRIGYVSGEFRNQATSVLLTEVLECHDRAKFEVYAFDNGWGDSSRLRQRIESAVTVVPIRWLDQEAAVEAVVQNRIDVLVNLNGYFGRARHHLFAARPAAVQVNYLGFPGTTGMPFIDYLIADEVVIPHEAHAHYTEKVVYLPDSYQPNDSQRQVAAIPCTRAEAGLPDDAFVFCCMNNVYKIMPLVFDVWMRLLHRVPGSVLMLYSNTPETQDNLRHEASARGVERERLIFGPPLPNERHLARLRLCDLFLDTLPYNAHTTGSDALWAGLPVLTCMGQSFPSRVGASLLQAVGLPELITQSLADYESLAIRLATEPGLLAALRQKLSTQLRSAPLYDTPRYTRHLEAAYSHMVERARQGLPPAAFAVAPQT